MQSIRYFLVLCCIWLSTAKAQDLNFININTDNGLPSNECYRIVQDKQGYIWISTEMGLAKYNGREFILFDAAKGLPFRNIYALDADSSGRVWFATGDWKVGYILDDKVTYIDLIKELKNSGNNLESPDLIVGNGVYKLKFIESKQVIFVSSAYTTFKFYLHNFNLKFAKQVVKSDFELIENSKKDFYVATGYDKKRISKNPDKSQIVHEYKLSIGDNNFLLLKIHSYQKVIKEIFSTSTENNNVVLGLGYDLYKLNGNKIVINKKINRDVYSILLTKDSKIYLGSRNGGLML